MNTPSSQCLHFGSCGGCSFQTTPYPDQLIQKEKNVLALFQSFEGIQLPIVPCNPPWNYRNKMEFSFAQARDGKSFLGLMIKGKRGRVENLQECLISPPTFQKILHAVRRWWENSGLPAYYPPLNKGLLRTLTIREGFRTGERMVILTISGSEEFSQEHLESFKENLADLPLSSLILRTQFTQPKVPTRFEEKILMGKDHITETLFNGSREVRFKIRAQSFFQPNSLQAEKIYNQALELAKVSGEETVLDLYCGTGAFGLFFAPFVKKVIGIEINPDAVQDARENAIANGLSQIEILEGDVGVVSMQLKQIPSTIAIIDPPRAGLSAQALQQLISLFPNKILYVSCNPVTQSENIKELISAGYRQVSFQPVDQFPHTPHIENIALLESKKRPFAELVDTL